MLLNYIGREGTKRDAFWLWQPTEWRELDADVNGYRYRRRLLGALYPSDFPVRILRFYHACVNPINEYYYVAGYAGGSEKLMLYADGTCQGEILKDLRACAEKDACSYEVCAAWVRFMFESIEIESEK